MFERAYLLEQGQGELETAIAIYQRLAGEFPEERGIAAHSLLRLGWCYQHLDPDRAVEAYQTLIEKFPEQQSMVDVARNRLRALSGFPRSPDLPVQPETVRPVVELTGRHDYPVFSPDAKRLLFISDGNSGQGWNLFLQEIPVGKARPLTRDGEMKCCPTWAPDGRSVAFFRLSEQETALHRLSLQDLSETLLTRLRCGRDCVSGLDWSADGRWLVFPDRSRADEPFSLFRLDLATLEITRLTFPAPADFGDWSPAVSPDGKLVAFVRTSGILAHDIHLLSLSTHETRILTFDKWEIQGLDWTHDGQELMFSSDRGMGSHHLWRVPIAGGGPRLVGVGGNSFRPALSARPQRLVFVRKRRSNNIWRMPGPAAGPGAGGALRSIASPASDSTPHVSPDGRRIAFQSFRSGASEIWLTSTDGSQTRKLTYFSGPLAGTPRWSPDGERLAFDARVEGHADVFVISVHGGPPSRLTTHPSHDSVPSWSHDGRWVYYSSDRNGSWQVWKVPAEGGEPVQVTQTGGHEAWESPDGGWLYYLKERTRRPGPTPLGQLDVLPPPTGIWRVRPDGSQEERLPELDALAYRGYWSVANGGIYVVDLQARPHPILNFFSLEDRALRPVAEFERNPAIPPTGGFALSPDGRWIYFTRTDLVQDILLVDPFP